MSKQAFKRVRRALKMEVSRQPLDSWAWPGGYPIFYITSDGAALCPDCVNKEIEQIDASVTAKENDGWRVVAADINYEDGELTCDHCSKRIESAYAESEVQS